MILQCVSFSFQWFNSVVEGESVVWIFIYEVAFVWDMRV
jgi:hypothetical protein